MKHEMKWTDIPFAERSDIGRICLMAPNCDPLAIEDTLEMCLKTCVECGMTSLDENGDPRPMTIEDCEHIAIRISE